MINLKGKNVVVIGAGKSGQSAVRLLCRLNATVRLSDSGPMDAVDPAFLAWIRKKKMVCEFRGHTKPFIQSCDLVILSPGVRFDAPVVKWAHAKKIPVWGEIELGARCCSKPIIAITGSNGKTTVSTLIAKILKACGKKVCLCGNVGYPFTDYVLQSKSYDYFVLEISSFQLETIETFKPKIAVFLNFTQNHLDRHKDIKEYLSAKTRIFLNQDRSDRAVLNAQDPVLKKIASKLRAKVYFFNNRSSKNLKMTNPNHLAVLAVARILRLPLDRCRSMIERFPGVEHRMERVRTLSGVEYVNDSKATTVEAGRWALNSSTSPVVMLCGGRDKHLDYSVLVPLVKAKVKKMIVYGEARPLLAKVFKNVVSVTSVPDLEQAVKVAQSVAKPSDRVLLSPMCTSYDQFKNFEERGRVFKTIVKKLKAHA